MTKERARAAHVLARVRELAGGPQVPREAASITQAAEDDGLDDHHDHAHLHAGARSGCDRRRLARRPVCAMVAA